MRADFLGSALARYADEQYARLSEAEKDQVRRIFMQLV
jgi:hypothetical protein